MYLFSERSAISAAIHSSFQPAPSWKSASGWQRRAASRSHPRDSLVLQVISNAQSQALNGQPWAKQRLAPGLRQTLPSSRIYNFCCRVLWWCGPLRSTARTPWAAGKTLRQILTTCWMPHCDMYRVCADPGKGGGQPPPLIPMAGSSSASTGDFTIHQVSPEHAPALPSALVDHELTTFCPVSGIVSGPTVLKYSSTAEAAPPTT